MTPENIAANWGRPTATHDPYVLAHFKPRPTDVLITTAPKAGTTWMQNILHQLRSGGDQNFHSIDEVVPWLEWPRKEQTWQQVIADYDKISDPRVFKTHCTYTQTPGGVEMARIILSSRDPRDCCVSFYHHVLDFTDDARKHAGISMPESFEAHVERWLSVASWYRNIKSWWPHHGHPNVLWLRYQDMKSDLPETINQICNFLEWSITKDQQQRVLEFSSFNWMKRHANKFIHRKGDGKPLFKPGGFIRKGTVGDYRSLMTPDQERRIIEKAKAMLPAEAIEFLGLRQ
ncbi:MAG: sulfotransferase domain-containing protein [Gammaproteobacteria bacterium]|nr:MAG: sulfotransferase domain-containing protein [Gammaproteobacteria bacterium]